MTRRAALLVVALVAAALVGVALLAVPGSPLEKRPTLGLDLQGGLEVTLQAVPPHDRKLAKEDLDRSVSIMRSRVDKLGVAEPEIRTQGSDQISIQLPGVKDPAAAAQIIGKTAQLELFDLERDLVSPSIDARTRQPIATPKLYDLLAGQQALASKGTPDTYYVFRTKGKTLVRGPVQTKEAALAKWGGKLPPGHKLFAVPPEAVVVSCGAGEVVCPGVAQTNPTTTSWYLMRYTPPEVPEMTGEDLKLSGTRQDFDTSTGEPIVLMEFTDRGANRFEEITRDIAQRGKLLFNTVGGGQGDSSAFLQHFAIVLDREIRSWPTIDFQEYPGGISGSNGAQISGLQSVGEAKDLALVLQTGALPVEFRTLDQTAISATLGKDSLQEAKKAAIVGLLAVAIFLLVVYRFLGLVAVVGLTVYAALLYAAILIFNVTLTLPGIAGLVLTLGVAADANIVIFERIKEEVRAGRSVRAAIHTGYTKGFATIVDANVVTAITALVLFAVATASVRGFALMLLVGTAMSMLTAVLATRAFLAVLAGLKMLDSPRLMGAAGGGIPRWLKADYIGRRNTWFAISATVMLISLGAIAFKGLNLGIDFQGGTQVTFATPKPVSLESVRSEAGQIGQADAQIQGRGTSSGAAGDSYRDFSVRTESLSTSEVQVFQSRLTRAVDAESFGVKNVSASFGRQIARGAILAIIVSLLLIVALHHGAVPVEVRRTRPDRARARHRHHRGHLRPPRPGGDDRHGRCRAHRARILDVRHDHHLRPHPREHPADEARVVPRDRERLAVGDDPAVTRDDVHHASADRLAAPLRRRHAEGLRLRAPGRDRVRRLLVDLHRRPARRCLQGEGARVRATPGRLRRGRGLRRSRADRGHGAGAGPGPTGRRHELRGRSGARRGTRSPGLGRRRGEARAPPPAPQRTPSRPAPLNAPRMGR